MQTIVIFCRSFQPSACCSDSSVFSGGHFWSYFPIGWGSQANLERACRTAHGRGELDPTAQENDWSGDRKRDSSYAFRQGLCHWGRSGPQEKLVIE